MNKVKVNICSSPTCYTQAAQLFKELGNILCADLKEHVAVTGSFCCGLCEEAGRALAPCARVNGTLLTNTTAGEVQQAIRAELQAIEQAA